MASQRYSTAVLTDGFAAKILDAVDEAERASFKSSTTEDLIARIRTAAESRDGVEVADAYKRLREHLHGGSEDEDMMGASITSGSKKRRVNDLLTQCNVVYGFVYEDDDLGSRNVSSDYAFDDLQRA